MIQALMKWVRGQRGYTLLEMATVVGVTATLTALTVPVALDTINDSKVARAKQDISSINGALASFVRDTGAFPFLATGVSQTGSFVLLQGRQGSSPLVASGTTILGVTGTDAGVRIQTALAASGDAAVDPTGRGTGVDDIENHLTRNARDYNKWSGPYLQELPSDPWGQKYLIYTKGFGNKASTTNPTLVDNTIRSATITAGAFGTTVTFGTTETSEGLSDSPSVLTCTITTLPIQTLLNFSRSVGAITPTTGAFTRTIFTTTNPSTTNCKVPKVWVISAGPGGVIETRETDDTLQGDDIGTIVYGSTANTARQ